MDASTGKPILIDGSEITAEKTFTAKDYDGTVDIKFNFDSTKLCGKTIVVFEDLYRHKTNVASHSDITDKVQTITFPDVETSACSETTGSHMGERSETAVIIDTVSYSNVIPGKSYTVKGTLVNKSTGKEIEQNGKPVTSEVSFTAEKSAGTIDMRFELDSTLLAGETVVVFEKLYRKDVLVGCHADLTDSEQSINYPEISTAAMDSSTKDNQGHISDKVTIVDKVKYENLEPGREYRLSGVLMDKNTNAPLLSGDEVITSELYFTAEKSNGYVEMSFEIDSALLGGTTTVVFENLYTDSIELAVHADINDAGQSIHWPTIKTNAKDSKTDSHKGSLTKFNKIIDTVSYTNLISGKEYTIKGTLMDKETGKPLTIDGKAVTAEKTFTAEKTDGTVQLIFHLDSRELDKKTVVVFEDLYHNDVKITSHADISDKDQSITYPEKPASPKTGDNTKLFIFAGLLTASAAAAVMLIRRHRKKEAGADEVNEE